MKFDQAGRELPDPRPLEVPAGYKKPESLTEKIRRMVRTDVSEWASQRGAETFEEANDFEIEEDDALEHPTHHELHEEVVNEQLRVIEEKKRDDHRRRAVRAKERAREEEAGSEGFQEETDRSADGDDIPRSSSNKTRARRSAGRGRREDAEEVDRRSRRTGRVEYGEDD